MPFIWTYNQSNFNQVPEVPMKGTLKVVFPINYLGTRNVGPEVFLILSFLVPNYQIKHIWVLVILGMDPVN